MSDMGSRPKVVVLLAAYNGLRWLPQQVDTILNQRGVEVSLIFSVDKSSDGTEDWVNALVASDPRVKALPHGRKFGGAAKNFYRLIAEADFDGQEYVSFADQDDIWLEDKLERAVAMLEREGADGYSGNVTAFWPDERSQLVDKAQPQKEWDYLFEAAGPGCSYVMTKALALTIRKVINRHPDEVEQITLHDWFCYAVARASGAKWVIDRKPTLLYRQHDSNQVGVNVGVKALTHRFGQFADGFWLCQGRLIASVVGKGEAPFVKQWASFRRTGLLKLAFSANRCRRRPRDQGLFFVLCLILAFKRTGRNA